MKSEIVPVLVGAGLLISGASSASAAVDRDVYFGVGCFWHVQHEFVHAEQNILGRDSSQVTSAAGYAGSDKLAKSSRDPTNKGIVCYHNLMGEGDYGKLGYGEVVGMKIPETKGAMTAFAKEYFSLFKNGDRPDLGDRGPEYRSLLGLTGGMSNPLMAEIEKEANAVGIQLKAGKGSDADTSGKKIVWVMDSDKFPFQQAEIYHQFHDGFMPGEQYPESYNSQAVAAYKDGRITTTGCPDTILR